MGNVYLVDGARTAFTNFGGSFANTDAATLGTATAKEAMRRAKVSPEEIDHVIYGNVIATSGNAAYLARHIGLRAGVPKEVPALTLNRLCGSGLQSIVTAAQSILLTEGDIILAGGAENMSQSPFSNFHVRFRGMKSGNLQFTDMLQATLFDEYCGAGMGVTAENLAEKYRITREEQDEFALLSHMRAAKAREKGIFKEEIVPVQIQTRKEEITIEEDEHIKENTSIEALSKLKPVFKQDGTVTAGNASGINDGAASVIVASEKAVDEKGLSPLARIVSWGIQGVDPSVMGIGPVPAIKQALERAKLALDEIDLIEINEAFAAQYLAVEKELGLNREITNVNGGAIALGHPVGASGTRLALTCAYELKRRGGRYGLVGLCIGGGQGIAMVIERV